MSHKWDILEYKSIKTSSNYKTKKKDANQMIVKMRYENMETFIVLLCIK